LSYQLNELKSKNIAGFIEIASTTFVESASMKIGGGQACSVFRNGLTAAE
jgi:hypothetical protein